MRGTIIVAMAFSMITAAAVSANAEEATGSSTNAAQVSSAGNTEGVKVAKAKKKKKKKGQGAAEQATVTTETEAVAATEPAIKAEAVAPAQAEAAAPAGSDISRSTASASTGAQGTDITATAAGTGAGASTTSLPAVTTDVKKRLVKGEFYSLTTIAAPAFKDRTAAPKAGNYVGLKFNVADAQSLSIRQGFSYQFSNTDAPGKAKVTDASINYTNSKIATFGKDDAGSVVGIARVYLPTGEDSRFLTKTNGSFFTWWYVNYTVGKFDLSAHIYGSVFNQTQNFYMNSKGDQVANTDYTYTPFVNVDWNITDKVMLSQSFGTDNSISRALPGRKAEEVHAYSAMTSLTVAPVSSLNLTVGVSNDIDMGTQNEGFRLMRDQDLTYLLLVTASI